MGRHCRFSPTPLQERTCDHCNENKIEDEFIPIMTCSKFQEERRNFQNKLTTIIPPLQNLEKETIFIFIMQCNDADLANCLDNFINHIKETRGPL